MTGHQPSPQDNQGQGAAALPMVERVADWLNSFKADPFSTGRDKAERLLEVVCHAELHEMAKWLERIFIYEIAKGKKDHPEDDEGIRLRELNLVLVQSVLAQVRGES